MAAESDDQRIHELEAQLRQLRTEAGQAQAHLRQVRAELGEVRAELAECRQDQVILGHIAESYQVIGRDWVILELNDKAARHSYGRSREGLVGQRLPELIPDFESTKFYRNYAQVFASGEPVSFEAEWGLTGKWLEMHVHASGDGDRIIVYDRDITDRREATTALERRTRELEAANAELARLQAQTAAVIETVAEMYMVIDRDWRIIDLNENAAKWTFRKPREELIGRDIWGLTGDNLSENEFYRRYSRAFAQGTPEHFEAKSHIVGKWFEVVANPSEDLQTLAIYYHDITGRKLVEEALRESEAHFAAAFRSSPNAFVITFLRDGMIEDVNDAFVELFGWRREEAVGKTTLELGIYVHIEQREKGIEILRREGRIRNYEGKIRRKDGELRDMVLSAEVIRVGGEPTVLSSVRDITEQKRVEREREALLAEVQRSQRLLAEAESLSGTGAWQWDLLTDTWAFSDEWRRIHGVTGANPTHEELLGIAHPDDREEIRQRFEELRRGVREYDLEHRIIRQDNGEERVIRARGQFVRDPNGGVVKVYGFGRDITERKRAEEALRESERFAQRVIDSSLAGLYIYDLSEPTMAFVSSQYTRITGYTLGQVRAMGEEFVQLFHPDDRKRMLAHMAAASQAVEDEVREIEYRFRRADGEWIWCLSRETAFARNEDGTVRQYIGTFVDITGRKQAEEALRESEERLGALVTATSDVVYRMSPDWREMRQLSSRGFLADTSEARRDWHAHYIPDDEWPRVTAAIEEAIRTKRVFELEHRVRQVDGSVGWVISRAVPVLNENGEIREWFGAASDITERKRAEEALQESEERYRTVLESTTDGFLALDREWRFTYVNERGAKMIGIRPEEAIGHIIWEQFPDALERQFGAQYRRVMETGEPAHFEEYYPEPLNRWFGVHAYPTEEGVAVYFRDVTERKQAEEALRESEEKFRSVFEQAAVGIGRVRFADARWIDVNEAFCRMLGYSREEMLATPWPEITHPEDIEKDLIPFRQMAAGEVDSYTVEKRFIHKEGHHVWARLTLSLVREAEGRPAYEVAIIEDITERKRAEEALREREERFRAIFENAAVGVARIAPDGKWVQVNDRLCEIVGYGREELLQMTFFALTHPDDLAWDITQSEQLLAGEIDDYAMEKRFIRKDGSVVWTNPAVSLVRRPDGEAEYFIAVIEDITEAKRGEAALRESEERFSMAFRTSPDGMVINSIEDGVIREVNEAYLSILGFARDEVIGRSTLELGIYPDIEQRNRLVERLRRDGWVRDYEMRVRRRDGVERVLAVSSEMMEVGGETLAMTVFRDITERKSAEAALRESEQRFRTVFENAAMGVARVGLDGRFLEINDRHCEVINRSREELLNLTFADITTPEDGERQWREARRLLSGEIDRYEIEKRYLRQDGSLRWGYVSASIVRSPSGQPEYFVHLMEDITERKQVQSELEFQKFALDQSSIVAITDRAGTITYVNDKFVEISGYRREELIGQNHRLINSGEHPKEFWTNMYETVRRGEVWRAEVKNRRKDGTYYWVDSTIVPEMGPEGKPRRYVAIRTDITDRKRAEQQLRTSEQRLRAVLEVLPVGVYLADANGTIFMTNEAAAGIWGGRAPHSSSIEHYSEYRAWWPATGKRVEPHEWGLAQAVLRGISLGPQELDIEAFDGTRKTILSYAAPVIVEGRTVGAAHVDVDITDRKAAVDALRHLTEIIEVAEEAIFRRDLEGTVTSWNRGAEVLFGYTAAEAVGRDIVELTVPEECREELERVMAEVRAGGRITGKETIRRRKDGEIINVLLSFSPITDRQGRVVAVAVVARDITRRKRAEEELRRSEEWFRTLTNTMPQLVWTANPDGRVDYYNERYREFTGIEPEGDGHYEWAPVVHEDDAAATVKAWERAWRTGEVYDIEHRVRMADGSYRWHLSRAYPVRNEQGEVVKWFGTATDIDDVKRAEQRLAELNEELSSTVAELEATAEELQNTNRRLSHRTVELEAANRELERFSSFVSHDLRAPLRTMSGFAEFLLEDYADKLDAEGRDYLNRIVGGAQKMREMIEDLLRLTRLDTQTFQEEGVDLGEIALQIVHTIEEREPERTYDVRIEPGLKANVDRRLMTIALTNLLENAVKFSSKKDKTTIEVGVQQADGHKVFYVRDNGVGFDMRRMDRVFEPFQRLVTETEYPGTGLGVPIVQKVIARHGGHLWAESKPGEGATFYFTVGE